MYLLDTNVLSEMRRDGRIDPRVAAWSHRTHPADLFLAAITILEIETGALLIARRDPLQGGRLRTWIDHKVLPAFEGRILPFDTDVALRCATLPVPDPRAERDAMIAATALVHRLKVVTRNVADFAPLGVEIVNPWQ